MKKFILSTLLALLTLTANAEFIETTTDKLHVWAEFPDKIIADGKTVNYIKVYEHNDDNVNYSAFNMEFILPEGFTVNKVKSGRETKDDIEFSDRATSTHSISCNIADGNNLRIIAYSSQSQELYPDDADGNPLDLLFTVGLIASPDIPSGQYTAEMKGMVFCLPNADSHLPAVASVNYPIDIVSNGTSGIDTVEAVGEENAKYYDLQGRPVNPQNLRNTIIISKGRKIYVK